MANKLSGFANYFNSKALPKICVSTVFYTQQSDGSYLPTGAISLLDNKVNESTLMHYLSLVNDKARLESRDQKRIVLAISINLIFGLLFLHSFIHRHK